MAGKSDQALKGEMFSNFKIEGGAMNGNFVLLIYLGFFQKLLYKKNNIINIIILFK